MINILNPRIWLSRMQTVNEYTRVKAYAMFSAEEHIKWFEYRSMNTMSGFSAKFFPFSERTSVRIRALYSSFHILVFFVGVSCWNWWFHGRFLLANIWNRQLESFSWISHFRKSSYFDVKDRLQRSLFDFRFCYRVMNNHHQLPQ